MKKKSYILGKVYQKQNYILKKNPKTKLPHFAGTALLSVVLELITNIGIII